MANDDDIEGGPVPIETIAEMDPNPPAPEDEFAPGRKATPDERRWAFEMMLIENFPLKRAARALEMGEKMFRRLFAREIHQATEIKLKIDPGTNFRPTLAQRWRVSCDAAAGLSMDEICGIMFRGKMQVSRFRDLFDDDYQSGKLQLVSLGMRTQARIMLTGNDRDAAQASRFVLKQKDLGGMRDATRYDHAKDDGKATGSTAEQVAQLRDKMIDDLVTGGIERAAATRFVDALATEATPEAGAQLH